MTKNKKQNDDPYDYYVKFCRYNKLHKNISNLINNCKKVKSSRNKNKVIQALAYYFDCPDSQEQILINIIASDIIKYLNGSFDKEVDAMNTLKALLDQADFRSPKERRKQKETKSNIKKMEKIDKEINKLRKNGDL